MRAIPARDKANYDVNITNLKNSMRMVVNPGLGSNSKCNTSPHHGVRCCDEKQWILPSQVRRA